MALGAIVAIATPLIQAGAEQLGKGNKDDPKRVAEMTGWYNAAIAGDALALCRLKYMTGTQGTGNCGGETRQGYATQYAKQYCLRLYEQALKVLGGQLSPGAQLPPTPPVITTTDQIGEAAQKIATTATNIGTAAGATPQPTTAQKVEIAKQWGAFALLIAVGALGVYLVARSRR